MSVCIEWISWSDGLRAPARARAQNMRIMLCHWVEILDRLSNSVAGLGCASRVQSEMLLYYYLFLAVERLDEVDRFSYSGGCT